MSKSDSPEISRRRVFAGVGTAGALAAAAAVLPLAAREDTALDDAKAKSADDADGRYQVTQHVLRYYQTTRV